MRDSFTKDILSKCTNKITVEITVMRHFFPLARDIVALSPVKLVFVIDLFFLSLSLPSTRDLFPRSFSSCECV